MMPQALAKACSFPRSALRCGQRAFSIAWGVVEHPLDVLSDLLAADLPLATTLTT